MSQGGGGGLKSPEKVSRISPAKNIWGSCFKWSDFIKPGGLDSRDQSRSRSRFLDLSRPTFENCQECPLCWDQLFFSVEIFKIKIFQSRFIFVEIFIEIVKINQNSWDLSRLSRLFDSYQDFLTFIKIFWMLDISGRWWGKVLPWLLLAYLGLPPLPSTDFYN